MRPLPILVLTSMSLIAPSLAGAQDAPRAEVAPAATPRPVGVYAGVEPGEAQPPPAYRRAIRRARRGGRDVILTWPGFTPLGDGGSRFFVQTTQAQVPELRVEEGRVVLLFRNCGIHVRNSARWLETRFFNTPVLRARLERRRRDMALVLQMRPGVTAQPRVTTAAAPGGNFHYVYVDFSPGDYAPVITPAPAQVRPAPGQPGQGQPPAAPAREVDPSLDAMDDERPPAFQD